jgi:hypothetical protein
MSHVLYIAGTRVYGPSELTPSRFDITKFDRTGSGEAVIDLIRPNVRRVDVVWKEIPDPELVTIQNLIDANKPVYEISYMDIGGLRTTLVYGGDFVPELGHKRYGIWYWKKVTTAFIEV